MALESTTCVIEEHLRVHKSFEEKRAHQLPPPIFTFFVVRRKNVLPNELSPQFGQFLSRSQRKSREKNRGKRI